MTDETRHGDEVRDAPESLHDLGAEFKRFGQQLGETVTAAWGSDTGRTIRNQVGDALREMARQLDTTTKKIASHEETQKLRAQAEQVVDSVRQSEIADELHEGLLTGMKELNAALEKAISRLNRGEGEDDSE